MTPLVLILILLFYEFSIQHDTTCTRALDKLRICVKYPIKTSKNPIKMDDLRIKTLFKYTITQFFELGLSIGKFTLPSE